MPFTLYYDYLFLSKQSFAKSLLKKSFLFFNANKIITSSLYKNKYI